jgi:Putative addiction module component
VDRRIDADLAQCRGVTRQMSGESKEVVHDGWHRTGEVVFHRVTQPTARTSVNSLRAGAPVAAASGGITGCSRYNPVVNIAELEEELLKLDAVDRARLAEKLLESLETLSESEADHVWLEEALRRDAALESGRAAGRSADEVLRDLRARLR